MSENKKIEDPSPEIKDEELDQVAGGFNVDSLDNYTSCKPCPNGCGRPVPWNWQGPCPDCLSQGNGPQDQDDI